MFYRVVLLIPETLPASLGWDILKEHAEKRAIIPRALFL